MRTFSINLKAQPPIEIEAESLSALEALKHLDLNGVERAVAVKINGEISDLSSPIESQSELEPIYLNSEEGLEILRHSTSHVMAMAVNELLPGVTHFYDGDFRKGASFIALELSLITAGIVLN